MRITYFGVRGSCPCSSDQQRRYGGNTSCVLVEVAGEPPLILDLGTGLRSLGNYLNVSLQAAGIPLEANVFLTHLHYDHVLGLPFFSPMRDPGAVLEIYGPSQEGPEGESLHDAMAGMVKPPFFPIHMADFRGQLSFHDLGDGDDVTLGSIKVKVRAVPHIGHTLGFRVEADGRSVAYISDHQAPVDRQTVDRGVMDLCDGADVVIHDAQYTEDEFVLFSDWGHSTPAYAVHVASVAGARNLHLFHHDPAHVDKEIDQILHQSRRMARKLPLSEVIASAEGMSFDLGAE